MKKFMDIKNGRFYLGDCLEVMKEIPDGVIDMILCDLPYGTTACSWDSIIPLEKLWAEYNRIVKDNGAMVFTCSPPFTYMLATSNIKNFKHEWVWNKVKPGAFAIAKYRPLRQHEDILVFCKGKLNYRPIMVPQKSRKGKIYASSDSASVKYNDGEERTYSEKYPKTIIEFSNANNKNKIHPTQKPVELFEYLIKTYTNEGELVLDNCAGSGTTAIAAENCGRKWVCIEQLEEYANKAIERILNHTTEVKPEPTIQIDDNIPIPEGEEDGNEAVDKVLSKIDKELMQTGCSHYEQKKEF